jgi:flagellar assembly factor FliW
LSLPAELPAGSVVFFPEGLPGFETARRFVLLEHGECEPVLLLQNVENDALSLPLIPAQFVDPAYQLQVESGDRELLGFSEPPQLGSAVCLLVLILAGKGTAPRCNLFAPIVINPASMRGKQVMQIGSSYPSVFPLGGG